MTDQAAPGTPPADASPPDAADAAAPGGARPRPSAETTQSFAPRPAAAAETTQSFAPRPAQQPAGTTQSFAPRPAAAPQQTQWNAPGASAPPEPAADPTFKLDVRGATSPVPAPLATQTFMPAAAAAPPSPPPAPPAEAAPAGPPFAMPAPLAAGAAFAAPPPAAFDVPPPAPAAPPLATSAYAAAPSQRAGGPALPARPTTLTAAFALAVVQCLAFVVSGAILLLQANGGGDWLQQRLDDYNRNHSATTIDTVQHALDVAGAGAIAFGVIVLLLALSSLLYGSMSRVLLIGVEVVVIALAGLGVLATPLSLAFAVLPIAVLALLLAPPTSRAFADARDAQEEWQAS